MLLAEYLTMSNYLSVNRKNPTAHPIEIPSAITASISSNRSFMRKYASPKAESKIQSAKQVTPTTANIF